MADNEFKVIFDGDSSPLDREAKKAKAALESIKPGASQAGGALISLSRVIQDAPFGFIAIQNNITELIPAFGRLSSATGGPLNALKALGGALIGPAGIGFAVSAVTSLITAGVQKYGSFSAAIGVVTGDLSKAGAAQQKFNDAIAKAGASAEGEVTQIRSLVALAQDESLSRDTRLQAIKKLNAEYPQLHKNLSIENVNTKEIKKSIDDVTDSLVRQAQVKGVTDAITEEYQAIAKLNSNLGESVGFMDLLGAAVRHGFSVGAGAADLTANAFKNQSKSIEEARGRITEYIKTLNELNKKDAQAGTLYTDPLGKAKADPSKTLGYYFALVEREQLKGYGKMQDDADKGYDAYFNNIVRNLKDQAHLQKVHDALNGISEATRQGFSAFNPNTNNQNQPLPYDPLIQFYDRRAKILAQFNKAGINAPDVSWLEDVGAQAKQLEDVFTSLQDRASRIAPVITDILQPAFNQLFDSILSGSQNAFSAVVTFLKNLVKQILVTIASAAALAAVLSLAGLGGGSSFGSLFKGLLGGGKGGSGLGSLFGSSVGGGSGFGFAGALSLSATVSGKDLRFVLGRADDSNGRIGG